MQSLTTLPPDNPRADPNAAPYFITAQPGIVATRKDGSKAPYVIDRTGAVTRLSDVVSVDWP